MGIQKPPYVGKRGTIEHPAWYAGQKGWGNRHTPDVYVLDTTQNYPIGTKFIDGERVFIYGYFYHDSSVGTRAMGGICNRATASAITAKAVIHAVGEKEIVLADTTSTVNQWAGGYFMPRVHPYSYYRVLSNTATDDTNVTLTLERGLLTAMASGEDGFLNQHPYSKMGCELPNAGRTDVSFVGVNLVLAVNSRYMWVQTWGPCYLSGGDERLGAAADRRTAYFHQDGTNYCPATANQQQVAGWAMNESDTTATWYIYLMIAR